MGYRIVYKDGNEKRIEIGNNIMPLYCPSNNKDGNVYHIDDDAVKILHGIIVNMTHEKANFFMENDEVNHFIPVSGIVWSLDTDRYSGYTSVFRKPSISLSNPSIRNFSLGALVRSSFGLREDTTYYSNKGVLFKDIALYNTIITDHNLYIHDLDEFERIIKGANGYNNILAANLNEIRELMLGIVTIMMNEAGSNKAFEIKSKVINEMQTGIRKTVSFPEFFEKTFRSYSSIDEYLQDRKVPLNPVFK